MILLYAMPANKTISKPSIYFLIKTITKKSTFVYIHDY